MIEQAFISGEIGKAIYRQDSRYYLIDLESKNRPKECRPGDLGLLFDTGAEFTVVSGKEIEIDEITALLELNCKAQDALAVIICGLDSELSNETRSLCLEAAEELLQDDSIRTFVRNRVLARILPRVADPDGAIDISVKANLSIVNSLYREILQSEHAIETILGVWEEVALEFFPLEEDCAKAERVLIDLGFFADTVSVLNIGDIKKLNSVVVKYGFKEKSNDHLPQPIHLMNAIRVQLSTRFTSEQSQEPNAPELEQSETETSDPIIELIKGFEKKRDRRELKLFGAQAALDRVDRQIKVIKDLIRRGNIHKANLFLRDLILFNLEHGKKGHAGMTLCSLAKTALDASQLEMAERLAQYASMLGVDDAVIPTTQAEVSKAMRRFDEALNLYEEIIKRFPNDKVAPNGRANVLKEMGRLDGALAAYDEIIERFPNEVVPYAGRAEVLKEMSRFEEALSAYNQAIERFPNDVFAYAGRANVLKEMGRLDGALAAYDEIIERFPNEVVPYAGRAEVLKEMGRLDGALAAYDEIIERFPNEVVPYAGRAEVLKEMGRLDGALAAYDEIIERFPKEAVPYNGRAEVLKEMGRLDGALAAYDDAIQRFPNDAVPYNGRANVLKEMEHFEQALVAYDHAITRFPYAAVSRNGRAGVLMLMDRHEEAKSLLSHTDLLSKSSWINYHIAAMSLLKVGDIDEAINRLEYGLQNVPWARFKNFFATALAVAKIKKKAFTEVVEILETNVVYVDIFQRQKHLLLISHSQAELGREEDAVNALDAIEYLQNPHIAKLRGALSQRYSLSQITARQSLEGEISSLEKDIEKEEFFLAMAA
jgi:tetratricopeptide (TPR) repeat protein